MIEGENKEDVSAAVDLIETAIDGTGYVLLDYDDSLLMLNSSYSDAFIYVLSRLLVLALSLLSVVVAMMYWTKKRMFEFSVRKAFGENVFSILFSIYIDISLLYVLSGFAAFVLYIVLCYFLNTNMINLADYIKGLCEVFLKCYAGLTLFVMIVPIVKLVRFTPLNLFRDSGEV